MIKLIFNIWVIIVCTNLLLGSRVHIVKIVVPMWIKRIFHSNKIIEIWELLLSVFGVTLDTFSRVVY